MRPLTDGFRLVRYDQRLNGLSDHTAADLSLDTMVEDLECVVDAAELEGARVEVDIMGSGDVAVWANEHLTAEIMGSGDISYRGSPTVEQQERGSGEVRQM